MFSKALLVEQERGLEPAGLSTWSDRTRAGSSGVFRAHGSMEKSLPLWGPSFHRGCWKLYLVVPELVAGGAPPLLFCLPRTKKGLHPVERGDLSLFPAIKWGSVHTQTLSLKGIQDVLTRPVEQLNNFPVTNLPYLFCSNRLIVSSKRLRCS